MEIFTQSGLLGSFRLLHILAAVVWMGLLYFFNFIQTPAYAEMKPAARNNAFDKVTWRALWWFRWGSVATWVTGLLILAVGAMGDIKIYNGAFFKSPRGMVFSTAFLFAFIMLYNVWMVIWRAQQVVIANARAVQGGGEANPDAPKSERAGAMASRQNTIFSFTVFMAMVGTTFLFATDHWASEVAGGKRIVWWLIMIAIAVVMEMNALGKFGTEVGKPNTLMYDTHKNAIIAASGLAVFVYVLAEILLRA